MTEHNFEQMRKAMVVSQLRTSGVSDPRVVAAMGVVPRERFVPGDRSGTAYADLMIPLAGGRALNFPMTLGRLLTLAEIEPGDRVLVIGAATGYAAACCAELASSVVALEEDKNLLAAAKSNLAGSKVELVEGPLNAGWGAGAPYDVIIIDGAVETVPDGIVAQLASGGRLATSVLDNGVARISVGREIAGSFGIAAVADAGAPALPGFDRPRGFSF